MTFPNQLCTDLNGSFLGPFMHVGWEYFGATKTGDVIRHNQSCGFTRYCY